MEAYYAAAIGIIRVLVDGMKARSIGLTGKRTQIVVATLALIFATIVTQRGDWVGLVTTWWVVLSGSIAFDQITKREV